jgi:hypothetical protein
MALSLHTRILLAWILILRVIPIAAQEHSQIGEELQRDSSFLQAMAVNAASVSTFDVLLRQDFTHDISATSFRHIHFLTRMIADFDEERFLVIHFGEVKGTVDGEESHLAVRFGAHCDSGEYRETSFTRRPAIREMDFRNALLKLIDIVNIRFVGFRQFPVTYSPHFDFDRFAAVTEHLDRQSTAQRIGQREIEVSLKKTFSNSDDVKLQKWVFDQERLIATNYYESISRPEHGVPTLYPITRESYQWKEFSGAFVPIKLKAVQSGSELKRESNNVLKYEIDIDADFHWFTVNESISPERFDPQYLNDASTAFSLVDPKLSGANTLP